MHYYYFKALHIIFVIAWFAGLFYMPRLFIYHIEAMSKEEVAKEILTKQFKLMSQRLWYVITWPSAILAVLFAIILLILTPGLLLQPWMLIKLGFVVLLILYHLKTHQIFKALQQDKINYSSIFMRFWNEGATLILFAIVFLAVLKNNLSWITVLIGSIGLVILFYLGILLYRKIRNDPEKE